MNIVIFFSNGDRIEDSENIVRRAFFNSKIWLEPDNAWKVLKQYGILRSNFCTFICRDERYLTNLKKEMMKNTGELNPNYRKQ